MNWGQDFSAWLFMGKLVVLGLGCFLGWYFIAKNRKILGIVSLAVTLIIFLSTFIFFGPGKQTEVLPAEEDGHRKLVESREIKTSTESLRKEAEAKKDSYLKQLDQSPEEVRKEANEYLKKVEERNRK